jgi:glycosyltransferase involved in cell wall biosynthesis
MASLQDSGLELEWSPFVPGSGWGLGYEPALPLAGSGERSPDGGSEVLVAHLVPEYLPRIRTGIPEAFLVAHTVWDTDRIPHHWGALLNVANLIVVPSRFSADAVGAAPVSAPVEIVGHVAPAVERGNPAGWAHIPEDAFVFYTIAEWTERKAVTKTIEAYLRAFTGRDRVLLVVKTSHGDRRRRGPALSSAGEGTSALAVAQLLAGHSDPPALALVTRSLSDADISALHHRGDCYVSLARGEGFALPAFDAAAYGNPVVTTGFGGQLDYLAGSPYLVDFELVPVLDPAGFPAYSSDQRWAEPDVEHAAALLRHVARNPAEAAAVCEPLAMRIRERYAPRRIGEAFRAAAELHRSHPASQSVMAVGPHRPW